MQAERNPWLVQRLFYRSEPAPSKGIDSKFALDYMGSAEFEFGEVPKALRRMRSSPTDYVPEPKRIKLPEGKIAWYVGPNDEKMLSLVQRFFADQVSGTLDFKLKEHSYIQNAYEEEPYSSDAWWAIDYELPWLLFKKKKHAVDWIKICWPKEH